ncbi:metal ABC transporter solute-binding protein, Zn/Mn family [Sporosarcina luteola]|uniref:metal ABC transporter solute-binding protein, Zn/Mn family n=1 Tax=Sporosarcina luteola TaxID=582850 RepID=UPI00203A7B0F|nr:zinc ABC transporter substrate-binding protein [Sporosarcina luteola]MCM3711322.1 zinc ABC transporter substrate-binding protein [Sporosarcina luteola]
MKRKLLTLSIVSIMALLLSACGGKKEGAEEDEIQIVATFSILTDIVNEVGGDRVAVHSMVPIGTDPHEYEPLPEDIKKAADADAIFYNGLNLEGGKTGWFSKLIASVGKDENDVYELMAGVEPKYITTADGKDEEINPHAFLDPIVGIQMVENARDALSEIDPDHKDSYEKNADALLKELHGIDELYKTKISEIPEEHRILVTSERAYQYMTDRYGLQEAFLWDIDTEEIGTPRQIKSLVDFIKEHDVPALFVETNVDRRPMETVSKETGVDIASELYSDELGKPGTDGGSYVKFLRYNIEKIHDGLMR